MARQAINVGFPNPNYVNETGTREAILPSVYLNETVSIGVTVTYDAYVAASSLLTSRLDSPAPAELYAGPRFDYLVDGAELLRTVHSDGQVWGPAPAQILVDGSATQQFITTNHGTVTLTTTLSNDLIFVVVYQEQTAVQRTVQSVTATGLTFVSRTVFSGADPAATNNFASLEVWTAVAASPLSSAAILVTLTGNCDAASIVAFGVNGAANNLAPYDTHAGLPVTQLGGTPTISTTNAYDLVLALNASSAAFGLHPTPTGFNSIAYVNNASGVNYAELSVAYQLTTAAQSGLSFAAIGGTAADTWNVGDAIAGITTPALPIPDGSATGTGHGVGSITVTLTTALTNDVICFVVSADANPVASAVVSSITGGGLTIVAQAQYSVPNQFTTYGNTLEIWWAVAAAPLSAVTFTVHFAGTADAANVVAFGVNGANTNAPFDPNVSMPATSVGTGGGPTPLTVSTTNPRELLLALSGNIQGSFTQYPGNPNGFILIGDPQQNGGTHQQATTVAYQQLAAVQTNLSVNNTGTGGGTFSLLQMVLAIQGVMLPEDGLAAEVNPTQQADHLVDGAELLRTVRDDAVAPSELAGGPRVDFYVDGAEILATVRDDASVAAEFALMARSDGVTAGELATTARADENVAAELAHPTVTGDAATASEVLTTLRGDAASSAESAATSRSDAATAGELAATTSSDAAVAGELISQITLVVDSLVAAEVLAAIQQSGGLAADLLAAVNVAGGVGGELSASFLVSSLLAGELQAAVNRDGSTGAEVESSLVSDAPTGAEDLSEVIGASAPSSELLTQTSIGGTIAGELGGMVLEIFDGVGAAELLTSPRGDSEAGGELSLGLRSDAVSASSLLLTTRGSPVVAGELLAKATIDAATAGELRALLVEVFDGLGAAELLATPRADAAPTGELSLTRRADATSSASLLAGAAGSSPIAGELSIGRASDAAAPSELVGTVVRDAVAPAELDQTVTIVLSDGLLAVELLVPVRLDGSLAAESSTRVRLDDALAGELLAFVRRFIRARIIDDAIGASSIINDGIKRRWPLT